MKRIPKIILIFVLVIGAGVFYLNRKIFLPRFNELRDTYIESPELVLGDLREQILKLPGLRATDEFIQSSLTKDGTLTETNARRAEHGLMALKENQKLNNAAMKKVEDMFR